MHDTDFNRIRQGDKTAFSMLVKRFQKPLFSYLGKMGLPQAVAEEVAQETFIRAWQARDQYDPERAAISTWLFTITRRLALNELQRAANRYERSNNQANTVSAYANEKQTQHQDQQQAAPSDLLQQSQQHQLLYGALQALSATDRSLLALAYLKELELAAIADIEGIPVGTVKSRLYRIRQQLKTTLNAGADHE